MVYIILGGLIYALGFNLFFVPNDFLGGGVGGIAFIITHFIDVNPAIIIFVINIPIFIVGYKHLDKHFVISSLVGMISFSFS